MTNQAWSLWFTSIPTSKKMMTGGCICPALTLVFIESASQSMEIDQLEKPGISDDPTDMEDMEIFNDWRKKRLKEEAGKDGTLETGAKACGQAITF
jgi:hypothetical protein